MPESPETRSDWRLFLRLLAEARGYWRHLGGLLLLGLLSAPLALLTPVPLKIAVDSVLGDHPLPEIVAPFVPQGWVGSPSALLAFAVALLLLIPLARQAVEVAHSLLRVHTGEQLVLRFRSRLFRHVQRLSLAYHDREGTGDTTFRIQWDAPSIQHVAVDGVIPILSAVTTLAMMLVVMVNIDAQLALVALGIAPVLVLVSHLYRRRLRVQHRAARALEGSAHSVIQEVLSALRVVIAFGQEDREEERFRGKSRDGVRARLAVTRLEGGYGLLVAATTAAGSALVLLIGVRHVQDGTLTLGNLLLVMGYLSQFYGPLEGIARTALNLQKSMASAERAFALLDARPDVVDRPGARRLTRATGRVELRGVSFGYAEGREVLSGVDLIVEPGTRVGIVGSTGAGKTTLMNLLTRFLDPDDGLILLDDVDLRDYRLSDLRAQYAIVLQEPVLFATTIAENIGYARAGATRREIEAAAAAAGAHAFISSLPEGYDTEVGERGMQLSGGERQRISLARAFLKDAPILILDEPTSSVDYATETEIMQAMERLMAGRTSFMIAHRTSTLAGCDMLVRVEDGSVSRIAAEELAAGESALG